MQAVFSLGASSLHISFAAPDIVRVRIAPAASPEPYPSFAVPGGAIGELPFERADEDGRTVLTCGDVRAEVLEGGALVIYDAQGRAVYRDMPGRAHRVDNLGRLEHTFAVDGYTHIYGMGEKCGELNRFGRRFSMDQRDAFGYDAGSTDPLYKHIPFIIRRDVERGLMHALFYDAPCVGEFDMGCERSGYWPRFCRVALESDKLDLYIILGGSMKALIRRYTDLTGKTAMPPLATIGHMASTMYLTEQNADCGEAIGHYVDTLHAHGFGCDGYHISSGYTTINDKRYVFNWNTQRFPEPERFIRDFTARGLLLSPNIKPAMLTDHPLYDEFAEAGAFLTGSRTGKPYTTRYWGGMASPIDMLSENGREMWKKHMKRQLLDLGINAIWDDNNEYELDDGFASTAGDERPVSRVRPAFANMMALAAREAMDEAAPDLRPYVLSRSGYAGIQRYAQTWAGDNRTEWSALKYNIPIMLGMSVSGVANQGCDIGGFAGPAPDSELFLRWVQNGIFQPRFCLHSSNDDNTITQPWSYEDVTEEVRAAFRLRYALAPYYYSMMRRASVTGEPIMRPMAYDFDDPELADESFDFMAGDFLLVANVLEPGARTRTVRLPRGCNWHALDTHERYEGGQVVTLDAPLSRIPVLYRDGTLLPMAKPALQLTPDYVKTLHLLAECSQSASFTLYQDDGATRGFERGEYLETAMTMTPTGGAVDIAFAHTGSYPDAVEEYRVTLCGRFKSPLSVYAGGKKLALVMSRDEFEQAEGDVWYFSLAKRQALIRFANPCEDFTLHVDYTTHDLIKM